jgi:hypothetical protein
MDSERLGRERNLAYLLRLTGLWGQRRRDFQQPVSFARRYRELESGEKDADDHEPNICSHTLRTDGSAERAPAHWPRVAAASSRFSARQPRTVERSQT